MKIVDTADQATTTAADSVYTAERRSWHRAGADMRDRTAAVRAEAAVMQTEALRRRSFIRM